MNRFLCAYTFMTACWVGSGVAWADDESAKRELTEESLTAPEPLDPLGRDSPRGAILGFLEAAREPDFEKAARYLDLRGFPNTRGPELARRFKVVLDRNLWVELDEVSPDWNGKQEDRLRRFRDRIGVIDSQHAGRMEVILARRAYEGSRPVWKVARETVARVDDFYAEYGYGVLDSVLAKLPLTVTEHQVPVVELRTWQLVAGVLLAFLSAALAFVAAAVLLGISSLALRARGRKLDVELRRALAPPLRLLIGTGLFVWGFSHLSLPTLPQRFVNALGLGALVLGALWLTIRAIDQAIAALDRRLARQGLSRLRSLLPLGGAIARIVVVGLGSVVVLDSLGINVAGIIAGLGIGGLAVALAAQKTLENLFGGLSVLADEPVRIGDFCRIGDVVGFVERIGLRSTRIRTLNRTLLAIPNAEFSTSQLENFTKRDKILILMTFGVRYETSPDQIRFILAEVRRMLLSHARTDPDPARIRFVGFGASSLDFEVFCYVNTSDWGTFLAIREDIYLRIMDIVRDAGSSFAFPSQTLYMGRDERPTPDAVAEVEKRVQEWRAGGQLPIPDFSPEAQQQFRGTLSYPDDGSVLAPKPPTNGERV
ncbi:MAG: mechanosensitive ion channel family protein [Myxococcota bacterium]